LENWTPTPFEPLAGLAGGLLIGLSMVLLLFTLGRIAGISGIAAGAMTQRGVERYWRLAFLIGVVLSAVLYIGFTGGMQIQTQMSSVWLVVAGLLVGFGTRLGDGCTLVFYCCHSDIDIRRFHTTVLSFPVVVGGI